MVRVLVLVDEDVAERLPPALERLGEALEDLHGEHEHVVEVDGVRGVEAALVQLVGLGDGLIPEGRHSRRVLLGRDELVLRARDLRVDAARREALRVLPELLEACLDEPHLILVVVDREAGRVAQALRLAPQHPAARGVEGEDPDRARRLAEHALEPLAHLSGRLVRERDREDLVRLHAARADEMSDAIREDARLAGACAGDDEERPFGRENGLPLGFVQVREVALGCCDAHRPMLAVAVGGAPPRHDGDSVAHGHDVDGGAVVRRDRASVRTSRAARRRRRGRRRAGASGPRTAPPASNRASLRRA